MRKFEIKRLRDINEDDIGKIVLVEATVEVIYPIKEDQLKDYIIVDSYRTIQQALYLQMDTSKRVYRVGDGYASMILLNAPLSLYQGQKIRFLAKVVRKNKRVALKFRKIL